MDYYQYPAVTAAPAVDWDTLWGNVEANPGDFASWELILRMAESADGGLDPQTAPPENLTNCQRAFSEFLRRYPLCFGYWKKYADLSVIMEGVEGGERVYRMGVQGIRNSVDLWAHYCQFKMDHSPNDLEAIRATFEAGAEACGLDFLSHPFWDKYIAFEQSHEQYPRIFGIIRRVVHIPMHQYARYFESYQQLVNTRPLSEAVTEEELTKLKKNVKGDAEAVETKVRVKIQQQLGLVYQKTQEATNARWVYESEIKRPYFHVKPLDEGQLSNWRKYLDYEETQNDIGRTKALYERCLVACALYEEFWERYARWLIGMNVHDCVQEVLSRATTVFIPDQRPQLRLIFAMFEEEQGRVESARELYSELLAKFPNLTEAIYRYANFERRQGNTEITDIYSAAIQREDVDPESKAFLAVQIAKYFWHSGDIERTRNTFKEQAAAHAASRFFWTSYLYFEYSLSSIEGAVEAFEVFRTTNQLADYAAKGILAKHEAFLMERAPTINMLTALQQQVRAPVSVVPREMRIRKRGGPESDEKAAKAIKT